MKYLFSLSFVLLLSFSSPDGLAQNQQQKIDSLIVLFKGARHDWNLYANQFIQIGEPAIPALVEMLEDRSLNQWTRRIAAMTLNDIHSPQYIPTALKMLLDRSEDFTLRNHVTNGLKGHDLSYASNQLWEVYAEESDQWFRSNIAAILSTSDTAMAYRAYWEIYTLNDGYLKQQSLLNMVRLRPDESTSWYLKGLQTGDWMTANLSMDSLVRTCYLIPGDLVDLYRQPGTEEEVRWRITFVFGNRELPGSLPLLTEALRDPSWLVYNEASVGLSRMAGEKVLEKMEDLLNDNNPRVVKDAKWVVGKIKDDG